MHKFQAKAPRLLAVLAVLGAAVVAFQFGFYTDKTAAQVAQKAVKGEWSAEFDRAKPGEIHLTLQRRSGDDGFSMSSDDLPLGELQGLTSDALSSARTNVNFNIVREAGTFACEGFFSSGRGTGFWTLAPSEKFVSAMRSRGFENLTGDDLTRAAFNNLTTKFIDELKNAGYDGLTFNEVMRAHNHDVGAEYIRQVKEMGFERQPLETLIRMRNHDIDAAFVNEMKSAGFENATIEELIRLQNHDITLAFINDLKAEGYTNIAAETAIRLKNHNIDRDFIRRAKAQGYGSASPDELIRLSNRGVIK
jgi:hypothetical protein